MQNVKTDKNLFFIILMTVLSGYHPISSEVNYSFNQDQLMNDSGVLLPWVNIRESSM